METKISIKESITSIFKSVFMNIKIFFKKYPYFKIFMFMQTLHGQLEIHGGGRIGYRRAMDP